MSCDWNGSSSSPHRRRMKHPMNPVTSHKEKISGPMFRPRSKPENVSGPMFRPRSKRESVSAPMPPWRRPGSKPYDPDSELEKITIYPTLDMCTVDQESYMIDLHRRTWDTSGGANIPESLLEKLKDDPAQLIINGFKRNKLICATECFYLGEWSSDDFQSLCYGEPCELPNTWSSACAAAKFAFSSYNRTEGKELELKELIRVNGKIWRHATFYLTMKASDELFYEAEVFQEGVYLYQEGGSRGMELRFMRVARHYPEIRPELKHLIGPNAGAGV